jgi:hypothetical protein
MPINRGPNIHCVRERFWRALVFNYQSNAVTMLKAIRYKIDRWTVIGLTLVVANLLMLWLARGINVVGWDILGASDGSFMVAEYGVWPALDKYWHQSRSFQFWATTSSVLFSVIPGIIQNIWPSLYTPIVVMFLMTISFWLFSLIKLSLDWGMFFFGVAASGTLLTYLIVGHAYIAATIPYCLAIPLILRGRNALLNGYTLFRELVLWLVVYESAFHIYEPARSVGCLPLIAAITLPSVDWRRRIIWLAISGLMLASYSVGSSTSFPYRILLAEPLAALWAVPNVLGIAFRALFMEWRLDLPILVPLAVFSCFMLKRYRYFWSAVLLLQLGLIIMLGVVAYLDGYHDTEALRARRFVLPTFVSLLICSTAFYELRQRYRNGRPIQVLRYLLLLATVPALTSSISFYLKPSDNRSLPFTASRDNVVLSPERNNDARILSSIVNNTSSKLFAIYGLSCYAENTTDPAAFIERMALTLGPRLFKSQVYFVDAPAGVVPVTCRYSCTPVYNAEALQEALTKRESFHLALYKTRECNPEMSLAVTDAGKIASGSWLAKMLLDYGATYEELRVPDLSYFSLYLVTPDS